MDAEGDLGTGVQEGFVSRCVEELEARPFVWLWGELVARGMVTSLAGASGIGKSFVAVDVAAAVTRGDRMSLRTSNTSSPAHTGDGDGGEVLFISPDYEMAEVLRPRLLAAGAEMRRIRVIQGIPTNEADHRGNGCRPFQLRDDLALLEQEIERRTAAGSPLQLIVIDPFLQDSSFEQSRFDGTALLLTMQRLAGIAAANQVAILLVVNGPAKARAAGNHRLTPLELVAPSAWWIGRDPDRTERRLLLPVKANLVERTPARSFVLSAGRVEWDRRPIWLTAERFQTEMRERQRLPLFEQEFSELARAMCWLRDFMQTEMYEFKQVKSAADVMGFSERTLRRAFCGLKGNSWRIPGTNSWAWRLREGDVVNPHLPWPLDRFLYQEDDEPAEGDVAHAAGAEGVETGRVKTQEVAVGDRESGRDD
ncbi:AAA family ATPase [Schlesneria sp. DSM 10557]|uniref:AAA family ATPase n=1 Tax=Schlesneria sp. DSM 10557 TaxID=3044399 RepID=UPI0035A06F1A